MEKQVKKGHLAKKGKRWLTLLMCMCLIGTMIPISARAENSETETGLCEHHPEHTEECGYEEPAEGHECEICGDGTESDENNSSNAVESMQALIDALPDAERVTAENAEDFTAQLQEILELYQALDENEQEQVDITRCLELQYALEEADQPMMLEPTTGVAYLDANGNPETTDPNVTVVDESTIAWGETGKVTWYVVNSEVTVPSRITVTGEVHLILADGCTLNAASGGVNVAEGNSLTIYGQTQGTGDLTAKGGSYQAGIGGGKSESSGAITINGGTVTATGGAYSGTGIGGGNKGSGNVTINGGNVKAIGGSIDAGIGGGFFASGTVTINGGTVMATGASGIGGYHGSGTVTINGGTVTAIGASSVGIGGENATVTIGGENATVTITGGEVTATTDSEFCSGIGSDGENATVTITGGTVMAIGGGAGAGIGSGEDFGQTVTVTISGGFVTAVGGAGISDIPIGAGAAIGKGGTHNDTTPGTEIDERNFTNCVVLRQSANTSNTMIGAVYGSPTLKEDAIVPAGVNLTVPSGQTLTIGEGTTLTLENGSTLTSEGTIVLNGTLNGSVIGTICYHLTVEGGTATGTTDYNDNTYGKAGDIITLTPNEPEAGMVFDRWQTSDPNVTITNNSFKMPASALDVTAEWKADTYTITLDANGGTVNGGGTFEANTNITVTATPDSGYKFVRWEENGAEVSTNAAYSFVVTADRALTAVFEKQSSDGSDNPDTAYQIINGADSSWDSGSSEGLTIRGNGDLSKFTGVKVDGKLLDQSNYTAKEGSTIITLKESYLNTLAAGTHTVEILWTDGSASTTFTINANTSDNGGNNQNDNDSNNNNNNSTPSDDSTLQSDTDKKDDVPKTGDNTPVVWLFILSIVLGTGLILTGKKGKKNLKALRK